MITACGIDLDGVVYCGNTPVPGAVRAMDRLRSCGIKLFFLTNNSAKKRQAIVQKLSRMGIKSSIHDVYTSGYAAALYIRSLPRGNRIKTLVIGTDDLKDELRSAGVAVTEKIPCDCVLVGYDPGFTYEKISLGLRALAGKAKFIAANIVANFPSEGGRMLPGCGAMVGALEGASHRTPDLIVGKPNTLMLTYAARHYRCRPAEIMIIGDSLDEDILMASRFGSPSIYITAAGSSGRYKPDQRPTFSAPNLSVASRLIEKLGKKRHS